LVVNFDGVDSLIDSLTVNIDAVLVLIGDSVGSALNIVGFNPLGDTVLGIELSSELSDLGTSVIELALNVIVLSPLLDLSINILILGELLNFLSKCLVLDVGSLDL
jgi:hypothetical protein